MSTTIHNSFDSLAYFEKLKEAGTPEAQAKVQAQTLKAYTDEQTKALQAQVDEQIKAAKSDLATKGDVAEIRLEIEKVRLEIEQVRGSVKDTEIRLIKWQIGIGVALVAVMAKGFGWLGF